MLQILLHSLGSVASGRSGAMIHITTFQRKTRVLSCKGTSTDNHYSLVFTFISTFAIVWPLPHTPVVERLRRSLSPPHAS